MYPAMTTSSTSWACRASTTRWVKARRSKSAPKLVRSTSSAATPLCSAISWARHGRSTTTTTTGNAARSMASRLVPLPDARTPIRTRARLQGGVLAACSPAAGTGRRHACVGLGVTGPGIGRVQVAHDARGDGLSLHLLHVGPGQQLGLRRVGDESQLDQRRGHPGGLTQDAVVVAAARVEAVLGAGVGVAHPGHLVLAHGLEDLLVEEAGQPLRVGRAHLVVGLG